MPNLLMSAALASALGLSAAVSAHAADAKPTIVLVHGAFAESSSWNGVIDDLLKDGYPVIAAANPLRSVAGDAAYVTAILKTIPGPVVLVGHSYGGMVISGAADGQANVKALVYVDGFAAEPGESALELSMKFPGSTLGPALAPPVPLPDGGQDLYIAMDKYQAQFAADVPPAMSRLMAPAQRPATQAALSEKATVAAWKTIPSWSIYGSADRNIPPAALAFMAERAKSRKTIVLNGGSHVTMVSHPKEVAAIIKEAAASVK
jgi:pimeloyl-ACP methyl ester carboxylesterase